jgi:predicted RNA methylase
MGVRLACEAKLAYYPTDPKTLKDLVDRFLILPRGGCSVIDPCCGTGEAVAVFADYGAKLYGVELDLERSKEAFKRLDRLLNADAINGVAIEKDWASVCFLNPPYGIDSSNKRLELSFIEKYASTVAIGGVLILAINAQSIGDDFARAAIGGGYKAITSVFYPNNQDYKDYKQFFVVLHRINKLFRQDLQEFKRIAFNPVDVSELGEVEAIEVAKGREPKSFRECNTPKWKIDEYYSRSPLFGKFKSLLNTPKSSISSIETPNDSQAALLVATGYISRPIAGWLLKGKAIKVSAESTDIDDDGNVDTLRVRESFVTQIYAFNTETLEIVKMK